MKHEQVSERGVTERRRGWRGTVALFLRVVDIRTRIRRLVGPRKVGGTNEDGELERRSRRCDEDARTNTVSGERRGKTKGGCDSGPAIISGDWPVGPTTGATWLDERTPRCTRWEKLTWRNHASTAGSGETERAFAGLRTLAGTETRS